MDNGVSRYTAEDCFAGCISSYMVIDKLMESERLNNYIGMEALEKEQALNEELATVNEELASSNEELVSINENCIRLREVQPYRIKIHSSIVDFLNIGRT